MRITDIGKSKLHERQYHSEVLADGLRGMAVALSEEIGTKPSPRLRSHMRRQFPFEPALSKHLERLEALHTGLLETAPDAMIVVDSSGELVLLNAQAEEQFGYTRGELVGQRITAIIPEGFAERLVTERTATGKRRGPETGPGIELFGRRKDGSEFPIELMFSRLDGPDGVLFTAAIRNISVRKAAQKRLAQIEGRYRGLLEAAPDAMVVANKRGKIVLLNFAAERLFGYERDELLGHRLTDIIPEEFIESLVTQSNLADTNMVDGKDGKPGEGIELSGKRKDGSNFPIEARLSSLASPEGILVTAAIRDIGQRRASELRLIQLENRYRSLLEAAPDAMIVVSTEGEIILLNTRAELAFGYGREELLGCDVSAIFPHGLVERLGEGVLHLTEANLAAQTGIGLELVARRKDGTQFPAEVAIGSHASPENVSAIISVRDISLRRDTAAARSEQIKYRGIVESAPDAMVISDKSGAILLVNAATETMFGYSRDELLGRPLEILMPERFRTRHPVHRSGYSAHPHPRAMGEGLELSGLRKDGTEFPLEISLSPITTPEGVLVSSAIRDVTNRRRADDALKASEAKLRGLLESAPDAIIVSDDKSIIQLVNAEAERLFGYSRAELIGMAATRLLAKRFTAMDVKYAAGLDNGLRDEGTSRHLEAAGLRKDGSEFPIEFNLAVVDTSSGKVFFSVIRDVSQRNADAEALRLSEERHRLAVDVAEMGAWSWDLGRDQITWSEKFHLLYGLAAGQGLTFDGMRECIHPDDRKMVDTKVQVAAELGESYEIEYRVIWPDQTSHWLASRGRAERDEIGKVKRVHGVTMDITVRKLADEARRQREVLEQHAAELSRSNEDLQQFAYIAAHDLQEPLRMVASYTQLLGQRYAGKLDADADDFIAYAVDGAHRMQLLIIDLLAYCRVGTSNAEFLAIDSGAALDDAQHNLEAAIADTNALLTHDALPVVVADHAQLVQLFQNLLSNAIKYRSAQPPRIHVSATHQAGETIFAVRDNGLGIEPQYFDKIFVMFQRLHRRDEFSGTGIGLTLCRRIAERHGGRMWVTSSPNAGSTFFLALPDRAAP